MKNNAVYLGTLTIVLLGCLWLVTVPANAASWESNSPMVVSRYWHTATLLPDGMVLAAGGYSYDPASLNVAELFDPATGQWVQTGPMNDARGAHTATLLPNGQVLVTGGYQIPGVGPLGFDVLASAELFNPANGTWTGTGSMLESRVGHTATLLANGQVLVVGGEGNGGQPVSTAELYDPVSGKWSSTGHLNVAREWHTATLLANGEVLVVGGFNDSSGVLSSAELYDPASGTWTLTANPMNFSRQVHTATLLPDGRVLVAGGYGSEAPAISSAEIYDPDGQTWTATTTPLNSARAQHTATLMPDGEVLVTGGYLPAQYAMPLSSAELYNPATGIWTATNSLSLAVGSQTATLLPNGNVLVAGGYSAPDLLGGAEIYDPTLNPATGTWTNTGSMQTGHAYHTATLLPNGSVLVAGGGGNISSAELYDPVNGIWANTGALNMGRGGHTATLLPNGTVLVAGGFESQNGKLIMLASAELYDPNAGSSRFTGNMGDARAYHTATLLPDGKVLVAGGQGTNNAYLSSAELYDPTSETWKCTASMTTNRAWQTATLLASGKVLVAGGVYGVPTNFGTLDTAELFDPASGTWRPTGQMTALRSHHTSTLLPNGKVLVAGGEYLFSTSPSGGAGMVLSSAEVFDPVTGTWAATGAMSAVRDFHTATLLPGGKVLVAGNLDYSSGSELFDPASGTWSLGRDMGVAQFGQTATLLPDGRLLVAGGLYPGGGNYYSSAELYDPGLGYNNAWQPQIMSVSSPLNLGGSLVITGAQFRGVSEGSSGNAQDSPSDYPLVHRLRRRPPYSRNSSALRH